jgi:ABC-2 type transport system permease protein
MNANTATLAPAAALSGRAGKLDALATLARRELWEHRSLWIAPLVVEGLLAIALLFGRVNMDLPFPEDALGAQRQIALFTFMQWALAQPVLIVSGVVVSFYLLDCLYAERKDRSILFWKSLPLSDELTVGSKFFVATVVMPLGTLLLASAADLLFAAILGLRVHASLGFSAYEWLRTEIVLLLEVVLAVLWYAPIAAALLVFSAWIPRNPIVWATLVSFVPALVERIAFGTHYIWTFEVYRTNGIWHKLVHGPDVFASVKHLPPVGVVLESFDLRGVFTDVDLWLGVLAAIALTYAAARIRRYRDDT